MPGTRLTEEFNPLTSKSWAAIKLSLATLLITALFGPNVGRTDDALYSVVVINRSVSKVDVTVWDENRGHMQILKKTMDAGQEESVKAVAKPATLMTWKVLGLNDRGSPFKRGVAEVKTEREKPNT